MPEEKRETDLRLTELLLRARDGDRFALNHVFEAHAPVVLRLVRHRLGGRLRWCESDADLQQEVLMAAFQNMHRFEPRGPHSFLRWLTVIAGNVVRGKARYWASEKRDPARSIRLCEPELAEPVTGLDPGTLVERTREHELVRACLERLPDRCRRVIRLRQYDGRPWADVAREVGAPTANAAQMRYLRAVDRLRAQLRTLGVVPA